jgi:hypothetical protein
VDDVARSLEGFQQRCTEAWEHGRSAVDAARAGGDEETASHLDWAMSYLARFRLRVLDGEKLPGEPGRTRPSSSVGTIDEDDPTRAPFVTALKEIGTYFDAGLGLEGWDWSTGTPSGWLEAASTFDDRPEPWDLAGDSPALSQPMQWRRLAQRVADPTHPDVPAVEASAGRVANLFGNARHQAGDRAGSRKFRKVSLPDGVDPVQAVIQAHGDVISGDWYPGSTFPMLDIRLRIVYRGDPRVAKQLLGADLSQALRDYSSFVEDERFGLPTWPWSGGPPVGWKAAALRATADPQ